MNLEERISAFSNLGKWMSEMEHADYSELINRAGHENPWFDQGNVRFALSSISQWLLPDVLERFCEAYPGIPDDSGKTAGVVMPGNIPLAGFHDFLCILLSGNKIRIKCAESDQVLLPGIVEFLVGKDKRFENLISFGPFTKDAVDCVIATGSDNTKRYFEYYFSGIPQIIRGHRNSLAVIHGDEDEDALQSLGSDIFRYYGLGCRSISKVLVPLDFDFDRLFRALFPWKHVIDHNRYANNYEYYRSIYLLDRIPILDNNFIILKEDSAMASPPGVLYYGFCEPREFKKRILEDIDRIQCVAGSGYLPFGTTQSPEITDFADNIDTMEFLLKP